MHALPHFQVWLIFYVAALFIEFYVIDKAIELVTVNLHLDMQKTHRIPLNEFGRPSRPRVSELGERAELYLPSVVFENCQNKSQQKDCRAPIQFLKWISAIRSSKVTTGRQS